MPRPAVPTLLLLTLPLAAQAPADLGPQTEFVRQFCFDCHGGDTVKGKLDLSTPPAEPAAKLWRLQRLYERALAGEMPPPGAPAPEPAARAAFVAWTRAGVVAGVPTLPPDPGRVTVRRLSRTQYANTVRDLFGVAVPTAGFPADDLGYGFDTVGDALAFSTLHLETFLAAAGSVAEQVFDGEDPAHPTVRRLEAEAMKLVEGPGAGLDGDVANLFTNATLEQKVTLPRDGTYRFRILAGADQAGNEPAKLVLRLDGKELDTFEVPQRELREYTLTAPLPGGAHRIALRFPNDFYDPQNADPQRRDRNLHVDFCELTGPLEPRAIPPAQQWVHDAVPAKGAEPARLRSFARAVLPRLWRRAVTDEEVARLAKAGLAARAAGEPFDGTLRLLLQAALTSPNFLFRLEPGGLGGAPGSVAPVPGPGLAQRLSYFVQASTPDPELLELGRSGRLLEPAVLRAQVARLLADPRADSLATDFAAQWFELKNLQDRTPDPARFPGFDDALRAGFRRETELLFLAVQRDGRDVRDLLDCEFTHVDARLAAFYGLPAPAGPGFQRVPLPPEQRERGGVLGQGSFLAVTSNPTRTSPVKRGRWILDNLLGQSPPPPPPGNDSKLSDRAIDSTKSFREQLAQHRERPECAACHVRMDTLGFALEQYDAIGRRRLADAGGAIDTSGELPGGRRIEGLADLKAVLRADPQFVHLVAKKLFVYALGRDPRPVDRLKLAAAVDALLQAGKVTIGDLVLTVVGSEAFRLRVVEGPK